MHARTTTQRLAVTTLAAALSIAGLGACGSSGSSASKSTTTDKSTSSVAGKSDVSAACTAWLETEDRANKGPDTAPEAPPTPAQITTFAKDLKPMIARLSAAAPSDIAAPVGQVKTIVDNAAAGKDQQKLDPSNPEFGAQLAQIEKWAHNGCGFNTLDVMGQDYDFKGIGATVKSGPTSIKFTNMSDKEMHEIVLMQIKPGAGVTADELAAALKTNTNAAEQKYGDKVTFLAQTEAEPGKTSYLTANLPAGDYVAACFIGQGGKDDGTPHAQLGMVTPFTVK